LKISELKEKMEKEYGKTIDEIAATVPLEDLTVEEFVVIQVLINYNHKEALDIQGEHIKALEDIIFAETEEYEGPAYG